MVMLCFVGLEALLSDLEELLAETAPGETSVPVGSNRFRSQSKDGR